MGGIGVCWGAQSSCPHHSTRCHGGIVFAATKGPPCSKAGAAWILTAAVHLWGQGDEALHSLSTTLPHPGLGNTNKRQRALPPLSIHPGLPGAQLGPQLSRASAVPTLPAEVVTGHVPAPRKVGPEVCLLCGLRDPERPSTVPNAVPLPAEVSQVIFLIPAGDQLREGSSLSAPVPGSLWALGR